MSAAATGFAARYDMKAAAAGTFQEYARFLSAHARATEAAARPAPGPERSVAAGRPAPSALGIGHEAGASAGAATAIVSDEQTGEWRT